MEALSARIKNALHNLSLFSNFLLHYHFVLSFFIHRQHFHFCHHCKSNVHYPIPVGAAACPARYPDFLHFHKHRQPALSLAPHYQKSKFAPSAQPQFFILHYSFFIFHSPSSPPTPHYPSPRTIKNRNSRHRRNHNSSFFIFHSSFIKAPPFPLSPSFLSAPFSHFLTASYCCRVYRSPTAYSPSFSCRPLSSPRFS